MIFFFLVFIPLFLGNFNMYFYILLCLFKYFSMEKVLFFLVIQNSYCSYILLFSVYSELKFCLILCIELILLSISCFLICVLGALIITLRGKGL